MACVEAVSGSWNRWPLVTAVVSAVGGEAQPESMMTATSDGKCSHPDPRKLNLRIVVLSLIQGTARGGHPVFLNVTQKHAAATDSGKRGTDCTIT